MNEHDVLKMEVQLGINFPSDYRSLLLKEIVIPDELHGYLFDDYSTMMGINMELRNGEFSGEWDRRRLIIGNDASGNLFFLNVGDKQSPVYLWDHETHEMLQVAQTVESRSSSNYASIRRRTIHSSGHLLGGAT